MQTPTLERLERWKIRRSGAAMTITARDKDTGEDVVLTKIDTVEVTVGGEVIAIGRDARAYVLRV